MEHTVTVGIVALDAIKKLWDYKICVSYSEITTGTILEVVGLEISADDNKEFLELKYKDVEFELEAKLFNFDIEAYKAELEEESKKRELERLAEKHERERKEILEHYDWNDLRCKAAVAAMQGLMINAYDSLLIASKKIGISLEICTAKKAILFADALVKELKATV